MRWEDFQKKFRVMVIAHRGACYEAPGNTLLAFEKAVEAGAEMIEFDVHKTSDNHIVVIHDKTTKRTSEININVHNSTLQEVKEIPLKQDLRIPTLEEVFKKFKGKLYFQIEIKQREIAPLILSLIDQYDVHDQCLISSFWHKELHYFKKSEKKLLLSSLEPTLIHYPIRKLLRKWMVRNTINSGFDGLHPNYELVTPDLVSYAHSNNLYVLPWTADHSQDWQYMLDCNVDGIMTNYPRELVHFLSKQNI
ncbi:MAG: glycerophosphodiester phosphodiesterase [Candidatus Lokiarchaeota archaeon]|nr:glycerophosphodiester phosphodiesterase [Candidatus Lokiarchaeota archaeon]